MKKSLITILFLAVLSSNAQDYTFGEVSKEELKEQFYPLDSTADAAYLYRKRRTYFEYNSTKNTFDVITAFHKRVKIYTQEGFSKATQSIYYYKPDSGEDEKVVSLKAYTFNLENNKIIKDKLLVKDVFKEKKNKYWSIKKMTMPNIKEGCIIDIEYKVISSYWSKIDDLDFQFDIPVKNLDYFVSIPEYYNFKTAFKGYYFISPKLSTENKSFTINSTNRSGWNVIKTTHSQDEINYIANSSRYSATDIPALKDDEPYVSAIDNYRGGVKFELTSTNYMNIGGGLKYYSTTWEDVSKQVFKSSSFGSELDKSSYYKNDLTAILSETKTAFEKMTVIFQFVKTKVKWNNYRGKYTDVGVRKAYKEGVGNSADINLMLISMLRFAGLEANPVLVSTRKNGIPLFPTLKGFNYVISMVEFSDGKYVLLDATEPYSLPNILPTRALNWNGRKVTKSGASSWVQLTPSLLAIEDDHVNVKITEDLEIEGLLRSKYENLNALNYRRKNNHLEEETVKTNLEERFHIEIENFRVGNQNKIAKPISVIAKFHSEDFIEEINNKLYIHPLLFYTQKTNPFKLEDRKFPVDFSTPWTDKYSVSIQIPEGYKVVSLPTPLAIGLPGDLGVFKYQVKQVGAKINTVAILQFNAALIGAENYKTLKLFYRDLVKKQSEKIVLAKE